MSAAWFESVPAQVARLGDKAFFERHPLRNFFARRYAEGDSKFPPWVTLFSEDCNGASSEINLTIVKRITHGRARLLFAVSKWPSLRSDVEIGNFLRSRDINPATLKPLVRK